MSDLLAYMQAGTATADPVYVEPGSPRRGREVFAQKRCDACHAIAGAGGRGGPDLGAPEQNLIGSIASVAGMMANHSLALSAEFQRRGIPRIRFASQEMADVVAYLYFVNYANVRGTPARGAEVFVAKCSTCHSIGGGRRVGPDLGTVPGLDEPIGIVRAMWNHAPVMEQEHRKRGLVWPRFELTQAADLAAFLLARRSEDGR
jgi:cytochrome c2